VTWVRSGAILGHSTIPPSFSLPLFRLPGATVGIIAGEDSRQTILARVVWAQRAGADLWSLAGLEFLETLPGKALRPVPSAHDG